MASAEYERWRQHPLRRVLQMASQGQHVYDDQVADLRLDKSQAAALKQAFERIEGEADNQKKANLAEQFSKAIIDSLPAHHETLQEFQERRAGEGDPEAAAAVKQRQTYFDDIADRIIESKKVGGSR